MRTFRLPIVGIGLVVLALAGTQAGVLAFEDLGRVNATEAVWPGEFPAQRVRAAHGLLSGVPQLSVCAADASSSIRDAAGAEPGLSEDTPPPELTVSATSVSAGESVTVTLTNGLGGANDWLELAETTAPNGSSIQWVWVGSGVTSRTWTVNMPVISGTYEFRLMLPGYIRAATSPPITVNGSPNPPVIAVDVTTTLVGGAITATLTNGYGGSGDWLAFAPTGAPNTSYLQYTYIGAGNTTKTWTVNAPLTPGTYEFRLFLNNGYTRAATSPTVTVQSSGASPVITVDAATVEAGNGVTATLTDAPGGSGDWLAFASTSAPNNSYLQYTYVGAGNTTKTWTVNAPFTAGTYEFRLFLNNGYTRAATSAPITVTLPAAAPSLSVDATAVAPGTTVTATLHDGYGGSTDWLALAAATAPANAVLQYTYVGSGIRTRTWSVTMPSTPGAYEFRLFLNNSYTISARSPVITVANPTPEPVISLASGSYEPGTPVTITHPDPAATIRITLNGVDPTSADPAVPSGTTVLVGDFTLTARAFKTGFLDSAPVAASYTLTAPIGEGVIAAGGSQTLLATPAGRLYAWGDNFWGQLGDSSQSTRYVPVPIQTLTGVTALATGGGHSVAATLDGKLYAWGDNSGDGTWNSRFAPWEITTVSGAIAVAAGLNHTLAVTRDGAVYAWGRNTEGQLGLGSTTSQYLPTPVPGLPAVVAVAAGGTHSLALAANGRVYAWGGNVSGQLGDGTIETRLSPVLVAALANVVEVAAGRNHSLARLANGDVYAWGYNLHGQLGLGTLSTQETTPQWIPQLNARLIAAGGSHSLALRSDGVLLAWGLNSSGQLGNDSYESSNVPVPLSVPTGVVGISAGRFHSVAVTTTGDVWTWGEGIYGQLGTGSDANSFTPQLAFAAEGTWGSTEAPTLSLPTGTYEGEQTVIVSSTIPGVVLRYTLNGTDPTETDAQVPAGGGILIDRSLNLRVRAWPPTGEPSAVVSATYVLQPTTPAINPGTGTYTGSQAVTISCATSGVTLRYTLDGSEPTESSAIYTTPLAIAATTTVYARAFRSDWSPSTIATAVLTFAEGVLDAPVATPAGGTYDVPQTVTLSGPAGAEIRYTVDGSEPTAASPLYTAPFEVGFGFTTVRARAFLPGWTESPVVSATYTIGPATLTVRTYLENDDAADGQGDAAGAGVYVRINERDVGRTAADGTITIPVAPGDVTVTAVVPSVSFGTATITVEPGASTSVSIVLLTGTDVIESTDVHVVEAVDSIVPIASRSLTLSLSRDGAFVPVTRIEQVELLNYLGGVEWDITDLFHVSAGSVLANDPPTMLRWLPLDQDALVRVTAVDVEGFTHSNVARFRVGQYKLSLTLVPPPSNPFLPVSGIDVSIAVIGTDIVITRRSDASGRVEVDWLPYATLSFHSAGVAGGIYYYGNATMVHVWHTSARLAMLNIDDVINGVASLTVDPIVQTALTVRLAAPSPAAVAQQAAERRDSERRQLAASGSAVRSGRAVQGVTAETALTAGDPDTVVTISAESDEEKVPVLRTATLHVPRGTEKVTLKYRITSLEYPEWVEKQSPFDDLWTLGVFARPGGQQLFTAERDVNSQAHGSPAWQSDSTTGEIEEEIDVTELAAEADIELALVGSATNIRDALFPTTVEAQLGPEKTLNITDITPDKVPNKRQSSFYSIPKQNESNHHERWFTLKVTKPEGAQITKVKLTLRDGTHQDMQTLVDTTPNGTTVKYDEGKGEISVRATIHNGSNVSSNPPTTHALYYHFRVEGTKDGQPLTPHSKDAPKMSALWRIPAFPRYSTRDQDKGYDDWCILGTYEWLVTNRPLLRSLNDFSAEHARDFAPHTEHYQGVTMDMYHFYRYTVPRAPISAEDNYNLLAADVVNAVNGDGPAKLRVIAWVEATRAGLQPLLALADVEKIYYAAGAPLASVSVAEGWAQELIQTGKITRGTTTVLNTETGDWSEKASKKMKYNKGHNTHIHIALDPKKLLQWPEQ